MSYVKHEPDGRLRLTLDVTPNAWSGANESPAIMGIAIGAIIEADTHGVYEVSATRRELLVHTVWPRGDAPSTELIERKRIQLKEAAELAMHQMRVEMANSSAA